MNLQDLSKDQLIELVKEKDQDIEILGIGIISTMKAIGVKDFQDLDGMGKQLMKGIPSLLSQAVIMPSLLSAKFNDLTECLPLLDKYSHLIDKVNAK